MTASARRAARGALPALLALAAAAWGEPAGPPDAARTAEGAAFHGAIVGPGVRVAFIRTRQSRRPLAYRLGERPLPGARLAAIEPDRAVLALAGGGEVVLRMAGAAPPALRPHRAKAARAAAAPEPATSRPPRLKRSGEGAWTVAEAGPGSAMRRAGFAAGDRILAVGGRPPDALPPDARGWALAAGEGAPMAFEIDRGGRRLTLALHPDDYYGPLRQGPTGGPKL